MSHKRHKPWPQLMLRSSLYITWPLIVTRKLQNKINAVKSNKMLEDMAEPKCQHHLQLVSSREPETLSELW